MLDSSGVLNFSTDPLPSRDRVAIWREEFARGVVKMDMTVLGDGPFRSEARIRVLPDLKIWSCTITPSEVQRTPSLVAEGDDSVVLAFMKRGAVSVMQRNQDAIFQEGEAFLWASDAVGRYHNPGQMEFITLALSREILSRVVPELDKAFMKPIPGTMEALRLLMRYTEILHNSSGPVSPELQALSSAHIQDLVALTLGATRDAAHAAQAGGLRVARLQAIKADIIANLTKPGLTVDVLAARHGISSRYIRALFESEQTSFTDFVREKRLLLAHRMLKSPLLAGRSISAIAFECGFGDLSYFNHAFRRRFDATPSNIRAAAQP